MSLYSLESTEQPLSRAAHDRKSAEDLDKGCDVGVHGTGMPQGVCEACRQAAFSIIP